MFKLHTDNSSIPSGKDIIYKYNNREIFQHIVSRLWNNNDILYKTYSNYNDDIISGICICKTYYKDMEFINNA